MKPEKTKAGARRSALSVTLAQLLLASCGGPTPAAPDEGVAPSPPADDGRWRDDTCGQRVEAACAASLAACDADPVCAKRLACLKRCPAERVLETDCAEECGEAPEPGDGTATGGLYDCLGLNQEPPCGTGGARPPTLPVLTQQCGASTDPNACYRCEDEHCCDTFADCDENADCQEYKRCIIGCPAATKHKCAASCEAQHPEGAALMAPRTACVMHYCAGDDACGEEPLDACDRCLRDRCADAMAVCWLRPHWQLFNSCAAQCGDLDHACAEECARLYPSAGDSAWALAECTLQFCNGECEAK